MYLTISINIHQLILSHKTVCKFDDDCTSHTTLDPGTIITWLVFIKLTDDRKLNKQKIEYLCLQSSSCS